MKELIKNKENIIWSILIAISLLLIISSFIMISMIVNKLLLNRGIIGNLKAQWYGTRTIGSHVKKKGLNKYIEIE